jgi:hypothetical protein
MKGFMGRHLSGQPRPACPQHPDSYVVLDGHYGPPAHRRPRYRCYPAGVDAPRTGWHRFTETLPRQMTASGLCATCERHLAANEGPQTPRKYEFAARQIAEALVAVGAGASYREAAARARQHAGRFPVDADGKSRYSRHGQLVANWVEVFAPVVFEPHRRWSWPTEGSVLLDHLGFRVKATREDGRPVTGPVGFKVLAAAGYENGVLRLWHLRSAQTVLTEDWMDFLSAIDGSPSRVVTDGHRGTINAARALWPAAEHWRSEWHLQDALRDYLRKAKLHGNTREARALRMAFINQYWWETFTVIAWRTGIPELRAWIDDYGALVEHQLANRPQQSQQRTNPLSIGGLDRTKLDPLKEWLGPRAAVMANRRRLDRLLMLMQLQLDELADVDAYASAIRDWLLAHRGRPTASQRHITDHDESYSLPVQAGARPEGRSQGGSPRAAPFAGATAR